jgi:hypothetical protein
MNIIRLLNKSPEPTAGWRIESAFAVDSLGGAAQLLSLPHLRYEKIHCHLGGRDAGDSAARTHPNPVNLSLD